MKAIPNYIAYFTLLTMTCAGIAVIQSNWTVVVYEIGLLSNFISGYFLGMSPQGETKE